VARILIVGGSDAGISAGLRAREVDPSSTVTLLVSDRFPNYSICGLPFLISGETPDWHELAHRSREELESAGLELLLETTAIAIDPSAYRVTAKGPPGTNELTYERLVIATGARPIESSVRGHDLPGVHLLHTMDDSFAILEHVSRGVRSAVIVGAGYIGVEMADALTHRGIEVTLVGRSERVLPSVDPALGALLEAELDRHSVTLKTGVVVEEIRHRDEQLVVGLATGAEVVADMVILVTGVRPATELAESMGLELGVKKAIKVTPRMETSAEGIYAAGDCVETLHRLLPKPTYLPLGTTSHKQGRVAGENAVGGDRQFQGSLGTQVVKVFELAAARTGLRDADARAAGYQPMTAETEVLDHKAYYPGAHPLQIRVTGDLESGRLLGAQMVGHWSTEVAKRIDTFAVAIHNAMSVDQLSDLDLSYTPPFSGPWDPVQVAAQAWTAAVRPDRS
jgi:NADPH-dependent 2,4-dienoyl-CoA reductase/sulfur reductase-like enzyme